MPRTYLDGWYYAFARLNTWRKREGWKVMWKRRRIWWITVRNGYFWITPEERAESWRKSMDGMKQLHERIQNGDV